MKGILMSGTTRILYKPYLTDNRSDFTNISIDPCHVIGSAAIKTLRNYGEFYILTYPDFLWKKALVHRTPAYGLEIRLFELQPPDKSELHYPVFLTESVHIVYPGDIIKNSTNIWPNVDKIISCNIADINKQGDSFKEIKSITISKNAPYDKNTEGKTDIQRDSLFNSSKYAYSVSLKEEDDSIGFVLNTGIIVPLCCGKE
jgi:hypothetical protein